MKQKLSVIIIISILIGTNPFLFACIEKRKYHGEKKKGLIMYFSLKEHQQSFA